MAKLTEYQKAKKYAPYKAKSTKVLVEADAIMKTMPLLDPLLDAIEGLENSPMYRHKMKMYGKGLKSELVHALGVLNNSDDETQKQAFGVMDKVERVQELVKDTHVSKLDKLIKILETFHDVDNANVDKFVNDIVSRQYAMITEFAIDKSIITKLKKIMPMVEDIAIIQISQQISKQQLQETKGFGEESIRILEELFHSSGLKW